MKKQLLLSAFLIISILGINLKEASASHIPGANITYTCNPANPLTYTFTFTMFRKCPGTHPATTSASYFTLTNTCSLANPIVPVFNQVGAAVDVNQLCSSTTSNCSGGTQPGVWKYTYQATITFPADCDSWNLAFDLCCRDASSNLTGTTGNNMACSTTMNTLTAPCNNSPVVTAAPIPYACTNTNFNYCLTIADPEGDSVYYSMVAPAGAGQAPIAHLPGYSPTAPLNNFVLDPLTGCISFNHPTTGNYVVAMQINSYDGSGNLIASIIHDFQIMVISCVNTPPTNPIGGISNFSGTGTQLGPNTVSCCYGDLVCFDVVFQDLVDPGNNLTIVQDGTTLLPGATFVQTGTNPVTGTFCWTAQPGYLGNVVTFIANDDGCPVMGTTGFAVNFQIATGVYAGANPTICGSQSAQLQAYGATAYTWTPATGLSCTNCPNPVASPSSTTTYTVTGNLTGTCPNVSQVTVNVVPDFPLTLNPASATICANGAVQLGAFGPAPSGPYTYSWTPNTTLNNDTIFNPIANPLTTTNYTVTMTAANGCTKQAVVPVTVSGIGPTVLASPQDTTICPGESAPLTTNSYIIPLTCGISTGCTGTNSNVIIGTNTSSTTSYSPFYGSTTTTINYTNKTQYIFTAAELNAMGYFGGTIRSIAMYFTNSYTYDYDDVKIWMGCTNQDQFSSTSFIPTGSLTQVFGPTNNINPTNANWHTFNITDFDWDGSSNIVIQMCADANNASGSEMCRYTTTTPYYRCMYYHTSSTTIDACNNATGSRVTNRPNMRFDMCVQAPSAPTYNWTPTATLNNPNISNPTASPSSSTSYLVNVTSNGCTGSTVVNVNINNANSVTASNDTTVCVGDTAHLNSLFTGPVPTTIPCGMATGPCAGPSTTAVVGTGTTSSTTYGPFFGSYADVKYQFLYTAAELTAMGFQSGTITSIAFNLASKVSTGPYSGFTIRMGCTSDSILNNTNGWIPTAGVVYGPVNYTTTLGWNTFNLTTGFDWDGVSNIVIETCFDNTASISADSHFYTATPGRTTTMRYYSNTIGPGCTLNPSFQYAYHPNLRFTICDPPPAIVSYSWTPSGSLNNPNISNPIATPTVNTTYVVAVSGGVCTVYDTVNVIICAVLPVELLSFDGHNAGEVNELYWSTETEINNDYFTIERSADGINFSPIEKVNGAGNSNSTIHYRLTDHNPVIGTNYYRLKQTDFDGNYSYSDMIVLNVDRDDELIIYPNPSTNFITISHDESSLMNSIVKVFDAQGKVVIDRIITEDQIDYKVDISALNNGIYFVKINAGDNSFKGSFFKK